jgi:hypothetical protein
MGHSAFGQVRGKSAVFRDLTECRAYRGNPKPRQSYEVYADRWEG